MSRKLKLQVQISIDGFIAGHNGEMDWIQWNWGDDIKKYVAELTDSIDTIIMGRKLAQGFIPHWSKVAENPNNSEYEFAKKMIDPPKYIFTKTLENIEWPNTILLKGELQIEVNRMKDRLGKDIIVYGGAEFVSNLIKEELIDELHLFVNPTAIGKGLPIFNQLTKTQKLKLIDSRTFNCGINLLAYRLEK